MILPKFVYRLQMNNIMKQKSVFSLVFILWLGFSAATQAQNTQLQEAQRSSLKDVKVFTSLEDALKNPDEVLVLDLSKQKMDELSPEIGKFKNLKLLNLSNNHLKLLPKEIEKLKSIEFLILDYNQFTFLPKEVYGLASLKELHAGFNQISDFHYNFNKLSNLTILGLTNNQLEEIPEEIGSLASLKMLDLRNNRLRFLPVNFTKLKNIEYLYLSGNSFTELSEEITPSVFRNLKELHLVNTGIISTDKEKIRASFASTSTKVLFVTPR